jgi:hypothetical protein
MKKDFASDGCKVFFVVFLYKDKEQNIDLFLPYVESKDLQIVAFERDTFNLHIHFDYT